MYVLFTVPMEFVPVMVTKLTDPLDNGVVKLQLPDVALNVP